MPVAMYAFPLLLFLLLLLPQGGQAAPLRLGIAGLSHSHVHGLLQRGDRGDIEIVGIAEPDRALAQRLADRYGFSMDEVYPSLEALIAARQPEAVAAFGSIYEHLAVVEACAPRGIHVMVEKPLAVSMDHATRMAQLARRHGIQLLTNYETTWYPTTGKAYALARQDTVVGPIRKVVVRDGHRGPENIGIDPEFLAWLTDPVLNGGGAVTDFGCYGANLLTWLMDGARPLRVTATTRRLQTDLHPLVDDEATIILDYADAVGLVEASWNWPIGRKDMEIYGLRGAILADNRHDLRIRIAAGYDGFAEEALHLEAREVPFDDPFACFAAVVRGALHLSPYEPSSLENNLIVVEILDAARLSARRGRSVSLKE
ncbi:MAG: Gfo/Idh/MocA family oxidoreductase [Bacteroidia bacterium]